MKFLSYLLLVLSVTLSLTGCGGFSEQADPSQQNGGSSTVYFSGTVSFPSAGLQPSRLSLSTQAIQTTQVAGAKITVYSASDPFFTTNLLKDGVEIIASPSGQYSIFKGQLKDDAFNENSALVIRAVFNGVELSSLVPGSSESQPVADAVPINIQSDGAFRYLKEELLSKSGEITSNTQWQNSTIKSQFESLAKEFASRRLEIQEKFQLTDFARENYLSTTALSERKAGLQWGEQLKGLAQNDEQWTDIWSEKEKLAFKIVANSTGAGSAADRKKRKLRLLYSFLENDFPVFSSDGNIIFFKDRYKQLDFNATAPEPVYNGLDYHVLSRAKLVTLISDLIDSDLEQNPVPPDVVAMSLTDLQMYSQQGPLYQEKAALISRGIINSFWVPAQVIDALALLPLANNLLSYSELAELMQEYAAFHRYSVERVRDDLVTGGLAVFGESNRLPQGLSSAMYGRWYLVLSNLDYSKDRTMVFEDTILKSEPFYFAMFEPLYQLEYAKLLQNGESIVEEQDTYPNPITRNAARYLLYRKVGTSYDFTSKIVRRMFSRLQRAFSSFFESAGGQATLSFSDKRPFADLLTFMSLGSVTALEVETASSQNGFYKQFSAGYSGETPNFENVAVSDYNPESSCSFWNSFLVASGSQAQCSLTTQFFQDKVSSLSAIAKATSVAHLSVPSSSRTSVSVSGVIYRRGLFGNAVPADKFPVTAVSETGARFGSQSDENGNYKIENLPAGKMYDFQVPVKDILVDSLDSTKAVTLTFSYFVTGFEPNQTLPPFYLDEELAARSSIFQQRNKNIYLLEPMNLPPRIQLLSYEAIDEGSVKVTCSVSDSESNPVDIHFSFTSGLSMIQTTQSPRISMYSLPSNPAVTYGENGYLGSFASSPAGNIVTFYWHTKNETASDGILGDKSRVNIQLQVQAYEADSNRAVSGNVARSDFFDLDNDPPILEIIQPLSTDPAVNLSKINVMGRASDVSKIAAIWLENSSISAPDLKGVTYPAVALANNFEVWQINNVPVESSVENVLHLYAKDIKGNEFSTPVTTTFRSLDIAPPVIQLNRVVAYSNRNVMSLQNSSTSTIPFSYTTSSVTGGISYSINTTSTGILADTLTTRTMRFEGTASDVNGIIQIRAIDSVTNYPVAATYTTTNNVDYSWYVTMSNLTEGNDIQVVISAVDKNNNDSGTNDPTQAEKTKSAVKFQITTVDYSMPSLAILEPNPTRNPEVITTTTVKLVGTGYDASGIGGIVLCSEKGCPPVSTTDGFLNWSVILDLSEGKSNYITGYALDKWGFGAATPFTEFSPFKRFDLNDVTAPTMSVTSVANITTSIWVDSSYPEPPVTRPVPVYQVTGVTSTAARTIAISGMASDSSGIRLDSDNTGNFTGLALRMNHLGTDTFVPASGTFAQLVGSGGAIFTNSINKSTIVTHSYPAGITGGIQTTVPYTAVFEISDDGCWPVWARLMDSYDNRFNPYERPILDKREIFYLLKDTTGPEMADLTVNTGTTVSSSRLQVSGTLHDELSDVVKLTLETAQDNVVLTSANFTSVATRSSWKSFLPSSYQPKSLSVSFTGHVNISAGGSVPLTMTAEDAAGNTAVRTVYINVLPEYVSQIKKEVTFKDPIGVEFGGQDYSHIFLADGKEHTVTEMMTNAAEITKISGNQRTAGNFKTELKSLHNFELFYLEDSGQTYQSMLLHGGFDVYYEGQDDPEILRLRQETQDPAFLNKFITETVNYDYGIYHIFRETESSNSPIVFTSSSLIKFTPLLENVVYVFEPKSTAGQKQLYRFVNGFRQMDTTLQPSEGGIPASTGIFSATALNDYEITSDVTDLSILQTHVLGVTHGAQGVDTSEERVYVADAGKDRINRFTYINLITTPSEGWYGGFFTTSPISLKAADVDLLSVDIKPDAIEIEKDASVLYVANRNDSKIYKLDLTSAPPKLITSFGGAGYGAGQFASITEIEGYRPSGKSYFESLYIVDRTSRRVSIYSTSGEFQGYFGIDPLGVGGMVEPRVIGKSKQGWFVLDQALDALDFYNELDAPTSRVTTTALNISSGFVDAGAFEVSDEQIWEDLTNYQNTSYFTSSAEKMRSTTKIMVYLELTAPAHVVHITDTSSTSFTAVLTDVTVDWNTEVVVNDSGSACDSGWVTKPCASVGETGGTTCCCREPVTEQKRKVQLSEQSSLVSAPVSKAKYNYSDLKDIALLQSGDVIRYLSLENIATGVDRVQMWDKEVLSTRSTELSVSSSRTAICDSGKYAIVTGPGSSVHVYEYPAGPVRGILDNAVFNEVSVYDLNGTPLNFTAVDSLECSGSRFAVADNNVIQILDLDNDYITNGATVVQRINATSSTLPADEQAFQGPLDLLMKDNWLYVLEREHGTKEARVVKYRIQ